MSFNILIVPGYHGSGEAHWQTWLEGELPGAHRVTGIDWEQPVLHAWRKSIIRALDSSPKQTVIVAHSFGCLASALAIAQRPQSVAGAILVAPADPERFGLFGARIEQHSASASIAQYLPGSALNTLGLVIGSENDPWMKLQHAYAWATRWGMTLYNAGHAGHINVESGFGPWPLIKLLTKSLCELLEPKVWQAAKTEGFAVDYTRLRPLLLDHRQLRYA